MPKKKQYMSYICKDCEIDFLVAGKHRRICCPVCGDGLYVDRQRTIWMERDFNYKRPWTQEEDEWLLDSVRQGFSHMEIAKAMNRTHNAVRHRKSQIKRRMLHATHS